MGQKRAVDISLTYNGWIFGRFPQSTCKLYDHDHDDSDDDHDDDDHYNGDDVRDYDDHDDD